MSPALRAHLDAIRAGTITKTNVIGIRKAINRIERSGNGWSVPVSAPSIDDVFEIEEALSINEPRVSKELHDSGLKVLRNPRYAKRWNEHEVAIIASLDHFRLVSFDRVGERGEYATPVYRAYSLDHGSFLFRNIPWQSGGDGPEIVNA